MKIPINGCFIADFTYKVNKSSWEMAILRAHRHTVLKMLCGLQLRSGRTSHVAEDCYINYKGPEEQIVLPLLYFVYFLLTHQQSLHY